jgi:hypothetical protein
MSSSRLIANVMSLGRYIDDSEFRLLMVLAECPHGERYKASFDYIEKVADFTHHRIEMTVWNFGNEYRFVTQLYEDPNFQLFDLYWTEEDKNYVCLEWR